MNRNVKGQGATLRTNQLSAADRDGIRIGARVRLRLAAKDVVESAHAVAAATGEPIDWTGGWSTESGERLTLADARELLAAAPPRYAAITDRERMTDRELLAILTAAASATAAAINAKASRAARLSDEEYRELRNVLALKAAEAGAPHWRAIEGVAAATAAAGTATRAAEPSSLRGRWVGYLILHGKGWRRERAERMGVEVAAAEAETAAALMAEGRRAAGAEASDADALKAGEAARAARIAATEVADATATVADVCERLEAGGSPVGKAERLALEAALLGLSRRELADRYGLTADWVKKSMREGRARLAARWPDAATARREVAAVAAAAVEAERVALPRGERSVDVCRWVKHAPAMLAALHESAWREPMARPTAAAAERVPLPRRARGILPVIPYRTDPLPRMGWAQRTEAVLAAAELRAAAEAGEDRREPPSRSGDRTGRIEERDAIRRATARAAASRATRAARIATTRRRRAAAEVSGYPGRTKDLAAYIG